MCALCFRDDARPPAPIAYQPLFVFGISRKSREWRKDGANEGKDAERRPCLGQRSHLRAGPVCNTPDCRGAVFLAATTLQG